MKDISMFNVGQDFIFIANFQPNLLQLNYNMEIYTWLN